jgi:predicted nucleic acid-binding protein
MRTWVVDASVMLKWVVSERNEPERDKAWSLLTAWRHGRIELAAPTLWQYEVGNFLGRRLPEEAREKFALLLNLGIRRVDLTEEMGRRCFAWMREKGVTFYDAAYLTAAVETQGILITADEKFVKKMDGLGNLCLLANLALD